MVLDCESLYSLLADSQDVDEQISAVAALKAEVKRCYVDLDSATRYFGALAIAVNGGASPMLQSVAFSCMCHLIKRVILQNPEALYDPAPIVLPVLLDKMADSKPSVRSTAKRVFEDYYIACPSETELLVRSIGFTHPYEGVRLDCIQILSDRIQIQEGKFAFRPFTTSVVTLLTDTSDQVRKAAYDLLVSFFRTAHVKAKQDLSRTLTQQHLAPSLTSRLLRDIGLDESASNNSSAPVSRSASATAHRRVMATPIAASQGSMASTNNIAVLSVSFVTDQPGYQVDKVTPENVHSTESFQAIIEAMELAFEGKETEFNWSQREKHVSRLRAFLRGNVAAEYPDLFIWALKSLSDRIVKAVSSLRTSLASHGINLIKETAILLGGQIDAIIEPYLTALVKITTGAKKMTAQMAAMSINAMIINSSYSMRYLNHIQQLMNDKVANAKIFAATWMRLIMSTQKKQHIESSGGEQALNKCITKGLGDANPGVRESVRLAFWAYNTLWPRQAEAVLTKLDASNRKALERSKPANIEPPSQEPLRVTRAVPKAGSIREFIAKTREERRSSIHENTSSRPPTAPVVAPSQRLERKVPEMESPVPESSPALQDYEREYLSKESSPVLGLESDDSTSVPAEPEDIPVKQIPSKSVLELIMSQDVDEFSRGILALAYLMKGVDIPESIECARPASIPPPKEVESAMKKVFGSAEKGSNRELTLMLCKADMIGSVLQFVGTETLLRGAIYSLDDAQLQDSAESVLPVLNKLTAFTVLVDMSLEPDSRLIPVLKFMSSVVSTLSVESNATLPASKFAESVDHFEDDARQLAAQIVVDLQSIGVLQKPLVEELEPSEAMEVEPKEVDQTEADIVEEETDGTAAEQVVYDTPISPVVDITDPETTSEDIVQEAEVVVESPGELLNREMESKLAIFEDPVPKEKTPSLARPIVSTPTKLKENVNNKSSWFNFESNKEVCLTPLPQNTRDATALFQSLIDLMNSRYIDSHGLRKLITIVKGASTDSMLPAHVAWRKEKWLQRLQNSLLQYMDFPEPNEKETSQSLLLVYQLLETEPSSFQGSEEILLQRLCKIADSSSPRVIGLGALAETRGLFIERCQQRDAASLVPGELLLNLMDALVRIHDRLTSLGSVARELPMFVLLTMADLVALMATRESCANITPIHFDQIATVVVRYVGDKEPGVRKETYPVLVNLKQLLQVRPDGKGDEIFDRSIRAHLSSGQRRLLDYYCEQA